MTKTQKTTEITKLNIDRIRRQVNQALKDALEPLGLTAQLGNITYVPGQEARTKLVIIQPATNEKLIDAKIGQRWKYGTKTLTIADVFETYVIGTKQGTSRGWPITRRYRVPLQSLKAIGVLLK